MTLTGVRAHRAAARVRLRRCAAITGRWLDG
jgi:hypothetical protein